jgi:hypothetical protein
MIYKMKTNRNICDALPIRFGLPHLLILLLIFYSCSTVSYETVYPTLRDGKYDSEFPYKGSSDELESITQTVQRITSTGFYKTYFFDRADEITLEKIRNSSPKELSTQSGLADQSTSGTATIIHHNEGKVALLTCAHVVNYPDTVASYFYNDEGNITPYLEALLIKDIQVIYAVGFPEGSKLEIIALDKKRDLAIIGRDYHELREYVFPVFNYPSGSARDLEWGTFVYVFGYPMNYQMITKALVSSPNRDSEGSFLLDAVVNKGYSGGIVLAIRDGVPNFELVGIVQWVPEDENNIITPVKRKDDEPYNTLVPYEGEFYVKRDSDIKYGIAKIISIETIKNFIGNNKQVLYDKGYYLENYISE